MALSIIFQAIFKYYNWENQAYVCHKTAINCIVKIRMIDVTTYPVDFEDNVRYLLTNLYDYLKLINNPLAQHLSANLTGHERMHAIRHTMLNAIEDLKSENKSQLTSRQNRLYNILLLRYVEEQATSEILNQLVLSERQYYREHQRAIQTISQIIWDNHYSMDETEVEPVHENISLAEELDYLNIYSKNKIFYPKEEILMAIKATTIIAEQRDLSISLKNTMEPIILNVSQPVFRQFIIYVLNELIQHTYPNGHIEIDLQISDNEPVIQVYTDGLSIDLEAFCDKLKSNNTLHVLMKSLNVKVFSKPTNSEKASLLLKFDQEIHKILIVDDNPDTISLFKRYVANLPYKLLSTQHESDAILIAQKTQLMCIILDIMLPEKDGWQILQSYKSHPLTEHIPVLICSVLEMKDLAMSLGADGYLKKPPTRDEFLSTLSQWVV
jgi:CheY-like chemotaxis protein